MYYLFWRLKIYLFVATKTALLNYFIDIWYIPEACDHLEKKLHFRNS